MRSGPQGVGEAELALAMCIYVNTHISILYRIGTARQYQGWHAYVGAPPSPSSSPNTHTFDLPSLGSLKEYRQVGRMSASNLQACRGFLWLSVPVYSTMQARGFGRQKAARIGEIGEHRRQTVPPPPLYKLRPCPSYSRRRDRINLVPNFDSVPNVVQPHKTWVW